MNGPAAEGPASGPDGPEVAATGRAAPGYGAPPGGVVLPGFPSPPAPPRRGNAAAVVWAAAAIAILAGVLTFAFIRHQNSTADVRVIVPAPAVAGGLHQDYADEGSSQFQAGLSALRQRFPAAVRGRIAAAIYTNAPAGTPARSASFVLVYLGVNATSADDPAAAVKSALSGIGSYLSHVTVLQEGGGAGDTRFACETGISAQRPVVVCGWGTDRTVGLLVPQTPGAGPGKLAALMKQMEPDLVRR
jgi:hypothetical protein